MSFEQDRSRGGEWFVPRLEGLEDRTTPAGNVTVINGGGILYVAGDNAGNQLQITATGSSSVQIRALDATTTINGQRGPLSVDGVRGEYINLYGGDDVLVLAGTRGDAGLHVELGSGNDVFLLNDARHRGETVILGGAGDDNIILGNSTFRHYSYIDTGAGDDQVTALQYNGVDLGMLNPSGHDFLNKISSTFVRPVIIGFTPGVLDKTAPTVTVSPLTTNDTTPQLTGTVDDPGATVQVKVNGQTINATVFGNNWLATVPTALAAGTYTVTATATDASGNTSPTASGTLVIDTTAPATPTLNLAPGSDTGTVGDLRTDLSAVALTGAAEAGSTVRLYKVTAPGTPGTGTPIATTTAGSNGTYSFGSVALAVGANSFAVKATDAAGNSSATFTQTFTRNTPPSVANPIAAQTLTAGGAPATFNLANTFNDAETVVRLSTTDPVGGTGSIDVNLFPDKAPQTVANFLAHVNSSNPSTNYDGSIFHRLAPGFVLQGGGFKFNDAGTTTATAFPIIDPTAAQVPNEPGVSNTAGTIAMAKQGTNQTSVGTEFFFNLGDNSSNLDNQNGGFTVFGQVMNGGQQTVNKITSMSTYSGSGIPGAPPFPVSATADTTNFPANINASDLAFITSAVELTNAQKMTFSVVSNTNPAAATASVTGTTLTITPVAAGTTTITVRATDLDGSTKDTQIVVTVQ